MNWMFLYFRYFGNIHWQTKNKTNPIPNKTPFKAYVAANLNCELLNDSVINLIIP